MKQHKFLIPKTHAIKKIIGEARTEKPKLLLLEEEVCFLEHFKLIQEKEESLFMCRPQMRVQRTLCFELYFSWLETKNKRVYAEPIAKQKEELYELSLKYAGVLDGTGHGQFTNISALSKEDWVRIQSLSEEDSALCYMLSANSSVIDQLKEKNKALLNELQHKERYLFDELTVTGRPIVYAAARNFYPIFKKEMLPEDFLLEARLEENRIEEMIDHLAFAAWNGFYTGVLNFDLSRAKEKTPQNFVNFLARCVNNRLKTGLRVIKSYNGRTAVTQRYSLEQLAESEHLACQEDGQSGEGLFFDTSSLSAVDVNAYLDNSCISEKELFCFVRFHSKESYEESYKKIAKRLGKSEKFVDNALQRAGRGLHERGSLWGAAKDIVNQYCL